MLSAATVRTLEGLAQRSNASHPEGGLVYTFTEAANQAHSLFPKQLAGRRTARLTDDDRAQLAIVICQSLGDESLAIADDLMATGRPDPAWWLPRQTLGSAVEVPLIGEMS